MAVFTSMIMPDNAPAALLGATLATLSRQKLPPPRGAQVMLIPQDQRMNLIARLVHRAEPVRNFIKVRPKQGPDELFFADGRRGEYLLVIEVGQRTYTAGAGQVFTA